MAVVAQWQSTALWMQMLRVRAPSAALFKTDRQHADWFFVSQNSFLRQDDIIPTYQEEVKRCVKIVVLTHL
jgi:hypothetical protein